MSKGFALRLALIVEPIIVAPSCEPNGKKIAATVLLATPLAYAAALLLLALLAMLWRRQERAVEIPWVWLLGLIAVLVPVVLVFPHVDGDPFGFVLLLTTLYVAAGVTLVARVAIASKSTWLMRHGPAMVLIVLAIPNVAVFFSRDVEKRIFDFDGVLLGFGCWISAPLLLLLLLEALAPPRRSQPRPDE